QALDDRQDDDLKPRHVGRRGRRGGRVTGGGEESWGIVHGEQATPPPQPRRKPSRGVAHPAAGFALHRRDGPPRAWPTPRPRVAARAVRRSWIEWAACDDDFWEPAGCACRPWDWARRRGAP